MTRLLHILIAAVVATSALVIPTADGAEVVLCLERDGAVKVEQVWEDGACSGCEGEETAKTEHSGIAPTDQVGSCDACIDIRISGGAQVAVSSTRSPDIVPLQVSLPVPLLETAAVLASARPEFSRSVASSPPSIAYLSIWRC